MVAVARFLRRIGFAYAGAWSAAYLLVMGFDPKHYFEYLILAWSHPGERPAMINFLAVATTGVVLMVSHIVRRRRARHASR
jgi:hypothetical protein